ncbi:Uu.00g127300.m01.CDS01 [Anthostomella pinea]|uniref:Uu.00g127300.m01.CDS01 n=1 Tax=Anthostomella pinea TaxID=933095 RepID=A0AAI8VIU0_9PEZI|nr:Uu.00g127300.m01.CDS01 [Anthostomella pinea]
MSLTLFLTLLALLASTASTTPSLEREWGPVLAADKDTSDLQNLVPSTRIDLAYGLNDSKPANVTLDMDYPTILLEHVKAASTVVCTNTTVNITFDDPAAYERSRAEWSDQGDLVLVTNHQGNCDVANERGIFLARSLAWHEDDMTVVASGDKKDVLNTATTLEMEFTHLRTPQYPHNLSQHDVQFNRSGYNFLGNFSLDHDLQIFSEGDAFYASAHELVLRDNVTISGYLKYDILSHRLESLYFDIAASFEADLSLIFHFTAPYSRNFTWAPDALEYSMVNIPKLVRLGPSLKWDIGVDMGAAAAATLSLCVQAAVPDGHVHIDVVDPTRSTASGWTSAAHNVSIDTSDETTTIHASPYVDFGVELALDVLDGRLDLSTGVSVEPKYVNELAAPAAGTDDRAPTLPWRPIGPGTPTADCGLMWHSAFEFDVIAFATQWVSKTLYSVQAGVTDRCLG